MLFPPLTCVMDNIKHINIYINTLGRNYSLMWGLHKFHFPENTWANKSFGQFKGHYNHNMKECYLWDWGTSTPCAEPVLMEDAANNMAEQRGRKRKRDSKNLSLGQRYVNTFSVCVSTKRVKEKNCASC